MTQYKVEKKILSLVKEKAQNGEYTDSELSKHLKQVYEDAKNAQIKLYSELISNSNQAIQNSCQTGIELIQENNGVGNWEIAIALITKNVDILIEQAKFYQQRCKKPNILKRLQNLLMSKKQLSLNNLETLSYIKGYLENHNSQDFVKENNQKRLLSYLHLLMTQSEQLSSWIKEKIQETFKKTNPEFYNYGLKTERSEKRE
ncbi:MAG: hypothetical protein DSM107014_02665 [Gomphosphaeria aponina SAG 52.96 = DSM 107014]|uniref:Uncharacterized protein n=1 Tax=Gomphosphaeria aponina SAG 52.96 = DSM 107014 TaxID=1521640 RepID=A0A941JNW8_9CHRO|nr:hypothetical protein [Gomphosphaeria aponina SAG 52.96 = DSM 107014]